MKAKRKLSTEEIIKRLRQPVSTSKAGTANASVSFGTPNAAQGPDEEKVLGGYVRKSDFPLVVIGGICLVLVLITLAFFLMAKNRAEDLVAALDPGQVEGLKVEANEFNPNTEVTYIRVQEGQDRNVAVDNLGSTLPIISRFNLKTFTPDNYKMVGAAPWALTTNFAANMNDPALMRILLDNDTMIQAFLARADVEPLLEDPQMLLAFANDEEGLADFFGSDTVQQVLNNEQMLRSTMGSRFVGYLLVSRSGKYFREHPQEAIALINSSPTLNGLRSNPAVRKAVEENPKLSSLASRLLGPVRTSAAASRTTATATQNKKKKTYGRKK